MEKSMKKSIKYNLSIIIILVFSIEILGQTNVVLNEIYSRGSSNDPDWIEVYNPTNSTIDISGFKIYDIGGQSGTKPKKEFASGTTIPANGFLVIVTDDTTSSGFGLSSNGETVWFENAAGTIIDSVSFPALQTNESYSRVPRQQVDQKWGTPQPITIRDPEFGAVRLRAFGNYAYRVADPKTFHTEISGTRDIYSVADLDGQLRGLIMQNIATGIAQSQIPFLDLAANQQNFAQALAGALGPAMQAYGLKLEGMTVQSISLPEELQKVLDQKIGMGMVGGDMRGFPGGAAQAHALY